VLKFGCALVSVFALLPMAVLAQSQEAHKQFATVVPTGLGQSTDGGTIVSFVIVTKEGVISFCRVNVTALNEPRCTVLAD
jgi:hypothetical protein